MERREERGLNQEEKVILPSDSVGIRSKVESGEAGGKKKNRINIYEFASGKHPGLRTSEQLDGGSRSFDKALNQMRLQNLFGFCAQGGRKRGTGPGEAVKGG